MMTMRSLLAACALRGLDSKVRDAAQAYIHSSIDGDDRPATGIRLPRAWWPPKWFHADGYPKFVNSVIRLRKALYGHPEAEALWKKHLNKILNEIGWSLFDSHPGFWVNLETGALLAVYVDDLLLGAHADTEKRLWNDLASRVGFLETPEPIAKF